MARRTERTSKDELRRRVATHIGDLAYQPKVGQAAPIADWLRHPMGEYVDEVLSLERLEVDGQFNPDVIRRFVREHRSGEVNRRWELWTVLSYILWASGTRAHASNQETIT